MRLKRRCSYIQIHTFQPHSHTFQPPPHVPRHVAMPQLSCMLLTKTIGRITARSCSVPTAVQRHSTIMSAAPLQIGANKQFNGINLRFKHASTTLGNYRHASIDNRYYSYPMQYHSGDYRHAIPYWPYGTACSIIHVSVWQGPLIPA